MRHPTLHWPGRGGPGLDAAVGDATLETLEQVVPAGAPAGAGDPPSVLVHGDNLAAMHALLPRWRGRVALAYVDPPFFSGAEHRLATTGAAAFDDRWPGGLPEYLDMLEPRLATLRELLRDDGTLYVHLDPSAGHYVKVLLDELFGPGAFQREIVWRIGWVSGFKSRRRGWIRNHDCLYQYARDPARFTFHKQLVPHPPGYRRRGAPGKAGGIPADDVWNASPAEHALAGADSLDSIQIKSFSREKTGYPTQKPLALLRRIVAASSSEGDVVCDVFAGSGTTLVAAEQLGRRWLGVDASGEAISVATARLRALPDHRGFELARVAPGERTARQEGLPRHGTRPRT